MYIHKYINNEQNASHDLNFLAIKLARIQKNTIFKNTACGNFLSLINPIQKAFWQHVPKSHQSLYSVELNSSTSTIYSLKNISIRKIPSIKFRV